MIPDNWLRIKEIFGEALELPWAEREAFLRHAAAADTALLDQLLSMLKESERESDFLSRPVLANAMAVSYGETPRFAPSAVLARRFRIVRFIARGGMGEVYEAEDLELGGRVALKAIRRRPTDEPGLRALFKREIQLARRVTHPNVCRIFDLEQHQDSEDGMPALLLSMELIEGQSLSEYLRLNGPLTPRSALPLIAEIAAGLQAIHDAGIIHGDLKPANVMLVLRPGETAPHARVMDFGLAFPVQQNSAEDGVPTSNRLRLSPSASGSPSTLTLRPSLPGLIGGTPDYFAPEQSDGAPASIATDVYAFGLVIADMLGAPRPEPLTAKPADLPSLWIGPLRRALDPDPARRYLRPADLAAALDAAARRPARRRRAVAATLVAVAVLLGAAKQVDVLLRGTANGLVMTETLTETVECPSPDGKYLAGTSWDTGDLIVHEIATGKIRRLTHKMTSVDAQRGGAFGALFSPDGRRIVYMWVNRQRESEIRIVGTDGKGDRLLYNAPAGGWPTLLDYSPDGTQVLFNVFTPDFNSPRVGLLSLSDGAVRFIDKLRSDASMRFDADAHGFLFNAKNQQSGAYEIHRLLPDNTESSLVAQPGSNTFVGWSPDRRTLVFSSDRRGQPGIWAVAVSGRGIEGDARELAPNAKGWEPLGITRSGALFYRQDASTDDVYTAVLDLASGKTVAAPHRVTDRFIGSYTAPNWSEDGRRLVFNSTRELPAAALSFYDVGSGQIREVRVHLQYLGRPQWVEHSAGVMVMGKSADGTQGLFRVDPNSGAATLFGSAKELQTTFEGAWSTDGKYLYDRFQDFRRGLFRLNVQTRERTILYVPPPGMAMGLENLALSPDDRTLAFHLRNEAAGTSSLMLLSAAGGAARPLFTVAAPQRFLYGSFTWTPDSQFVLVASTRSVPHPPADEQISELWQVPVNGGAPRRIDFPLMPVLCLRLNRDGKTIAFHSRRFNSQIWVLQHFL